MRLSCIRLACKEGIYQPMNRVKIIILCIVELYTSHVDHFLVIRPRTKVKNLSPYDYTSDNL